MPGRVSSRTRSHPRGDLGAAEAAAVARRVVVGEHPGGPRVAGPEHGDGPGDPGAQRVGLERRPQEPEVEAEVQLVADAVVRRHGLLVEQVDLADADPIAGVGVEHPADGPEPLVHRRHVVVGDVVVALGDGLGWVVDVDVLGDQVDDVHAEPVDPTVQPEAQDVVHRRLDRRLVPVQVGLLGQEAVQVVLLAAGVERPRRGPLAQRGPPVVGRLVAPHVPVGLRVRGRGPAGDEPRVLVAGVVRHEVEQDADAAGRGPRRPARRGRRGCRTAGRRRSGR